MNNCCLKRTKNLQVRHYHYIALQQYIYQRSYFLCFYCPSPWFREGSPEELHRKRHNQNSLAKPTIRMPTEMIMRSSQLDASMLDDELKLILKDQIVTMFTHFTVYSSLTQPNLKLKYDLELSALLDLIVCESGILYNNSTYGFDLQNLIYVDGSKTEPLRFGPSKFQKLAHLVINVGGRYAWNRLGRHMAVRFTDADKQLGRYDRLQKSGIQVDAKH
jgi:Pex2 / Pex12 amino terminal region